MIDSRMNQNIEAWYAFSPTIETITAASAAAIKLNKSNSTKASFLHRIPF